MISVLLIEDNSIANYTIEINGSFIIILNSSQKVCSRIKTLCSKSMQKKIEQNLISAKEHTLYQRKSGISSPSK